MKKFVGKEECSTCIGEGHDWYLRMGEVAGIMVFGELEGTSEKSRYCFDIADEGFWLYQSKGKPNVMLTTSSVVVDSLAHELKLSQFVKVLVTAAQVVFEMPGRGKIVFNEVKRKSKESYEFNYDK
ncbi:hypothetical protein [Ralstonia pseudosolanacearum]